MSPCVWLNIFGALFSITGFALVALELVRIQRREFGTPETIRSAAGFGRRIRKRIGALFPRQPEPTEPAETNPAYLDLASARGSSSTSMILTTGMPLENQVKALEIRLSELAKEVSEDRRKASRSLEALRRDQVERIKALEFDRQRREDSERAFKQGSLALNSLGTALFVLGTALSAAANLISC